MFTIIDTTAVEFDEIDLDTLTNEYKRLLNAAYRKIANKIPTGTSKKTRKLIRRAIEVGVGIAENMYNDVREFRPEKDYRVLLDEGIEEVLGETKVTEAEKALVQKAIEAGIRESIRDNMVKGERYY